MDNLLNTRVSKRPPPAERYEVCPTCQADTVLTFIGEQIWPEKVARKMGISPVVTLWRCQECDTTLSLTDEKAEI